MSAAITASDIAVKVGGRWGKVNSLPMSAGRVIVRVAGYEVRGPLTRPNVLFAERLCERRGLDYELGWPSKASAWTKAAS